MLDKSVHILFSFHVWALCPTGYYLNGLRLGAGPPAYLHHIDEAQCCHPQGHPNSYEQCYDEDVSRSFDDRGWSECKQPGYYMTGFYKSSCNQIYCIEKFRCCKMKKRNFYFVYFNHESAVSENSNPRRKFAFQRIFSNITASSSAQHKLAFTINTFRHIWYRK